MCRWFCRKRGEAPSVLSFLRAVGLEYADGSFELTEDMTLRGGEVVAEFVDAMAAIYTRTSRARFVGAWERDKSFVRLLTMLRHVAAASEYDVTTRTSHALGTWTQVARFTKRA